MCPHQHPAESEKKAELRMNTNKEVTHMNKNELPHNSNNLIKHISNTQSLNCIGYKEIQECNYTYNKKRTHEYVYQQERHEYDRESGQNKIIILNNQYINRRTKILEQRRQRMERQKRKVMIHTPQVCTKYNNHYPPSNINIKHYLHDLKRRYKDRRINTIHTESQVLKDNIPKDLTIINMGIHNLTSNNFTGNELYLLSLGLKFKLPFNFVHDDNHILKCFDKYCDQIRLVKKAKLTNANTNTLNLCNKLNLLISHWHNKPTHNNHNYKLLGIQYFPLQNYIKTSRYKLKYLLKSNPKINFRHNTSHLYLLRLYRSINTLKANRSIIIKPTDKNLGIAIINIADYKKAGLNKLAGVNYLKIDEFNMDEIVKDLIKKLLKLQIISTNIDINNIDYSLPMNWSQFCFDPQYERAARLIMFYFSHPDLLKLCRLYLTPKVHKYP